MQIKIKKLHPKAVIPKYAYNYDAGMDVVAIEKIVKQDYIEYRTGLSFEIPEGYVMLVFPRSSISKVNLFLGNSVGVIDSGYRGELFMRFRKIGNKEYEIGEKVAQLIIFAYPKIQFEEVEKLSESQRGQGGFGSSGK